MSLASLIKPCATVEGLPVARLGTFKVAYANRHNNAGLRQKQVKTTTGSAKIIPESNSEGEDRKLVPGGT